MATFEDLTEIFNKIDYFKVNEKLDDHFLVSYIQSYANTPIVQFKISDADVDNYLSIRSIISSEPDTSLFCKGYYEQIVDILDKFTGIRHRPLKEKISLSNQDGTIEIILSPISTQFLFMLIDRGRTQMLRRARLTGLPILVERMRYTDREVGLSDFFTPLSTIKVVDQYGVNNKDNLQALCNSALFNIAYALGVGLNLSRSWERSNHRLSARKNREIHFPLKIYNKELVSYYQLALSSESAILAYISLYNILEYFFISTNETILHKRLKEKLTQPDFNYKNNQHLRELTKIVRKFEQKTDERRSLANVLEDFFMPDEIISWINEYELKSGQYYTVPHQILDVKHNIDLTPTSIYSSLAERIYKIRNALVHNKEGEPSRFIPFAGQEEVLSKELPIILFLAEQLIIKSGEER